MKKQHWYTTLIECEKKPYLEYVHVLPGHVLLDGDGRLERGERRGEGLHVVVDRLVQLVAGRTLRQLRGEGP